MSKIKLPANELRNADVSYISLVKRGANRIPFRITKGEDMLDLSNLFRTKKSEVKSEVLGYVVTKGADYALAALKEIGVDVQKAESSDTATVISKADADMSGAILVGLNEDVAVAVSRVTKDYDCYPCATLPCTSYCPQVVWAPSDPDMTPETFEKRIFSEGFLPSMNQAAETLKSVICCIVWCHNPQVDVNSAIKQAVSEFQNYVMMFVKNMPEEVMKAEAALTKMCAGKKMKEKAAPADEKKPEEAAVPPADAAAQQEDPTVPAEDPKAPAKGGKKVVKPVQGEAEEASEAPAENTADEEGLEEEKKACKKAEEDAIANLVQSFKADVESMVLNFGVVLNDATTKVAKLEQIAKEAEAVASSMVIGNADVTDTRQLEKSEAPRQGYLYDTAYQGR